MITGITFGAFDLLHAGHIHFLKSCKEHCDELIVGLHSDPSIERTTKNSPIQTIFERHTQLMGCRYVDEIIPYDTEVDIENMLNVFELHRRFLGTDYVDKKCTGHDICIEENIELVYIPRFHNYSTTELRDRTRWVG